MTREFAAWQDPRMQSPRVGGALIVHQAVPTLSLVELVQLAQRQGPVRSAIRHVERCRACGVGDLCAVGSKLAAQIQPSRKRTRGWLALRSADVAQAQARSRRPRP